MPVDLRTHDPDDDIVIASGTNKAQIVKLLYSRPNLGYKPSEVRDELDIPSGSATTTLLRLHEDGCIGKTSDGYYHALESRDDLRRFASGLVQVEGLADRAPPDDISPEDAEQIEFREDQLDERRESAISKTAIDAELQELEDG